MLEDQDSGKAAMDIEQAALEAQRSVEKLRQEAEAKASTLDKSERALSKAEEKLDAKTRKYKKGQLTLAGYPAEELLLAPLRPPRPAETKDQDPAAEVEKQQVTTKKKRLQEISEQVKKVQKEAALFNQNIAELNKELTDKLDR